MLRLQSIPRPLLLLAFMGLAGAALLAQRPPLAAQPPRVKTIKPPKPHQIVHLKPKKAIAVMEERWRTASLSGDVSEIGRMLSDDYVGISWNGQVNTKNSQLDRVSRKDFVVSKLDISDTKVKITGPVAIVTSRAEMQGTMQGTDVQGTYRYTRVYQQLPDGDWKVTNFEATRIPNPIDRTASVQHP